MFILFRMFMFSYIHIMMLNNWATNWWMLVGMCGKNHLEATVPSKWPNKWWISACFHPALCLPVVILPWSFPDRVRRQLSLTHRRPRRNRFSQSSQRLRRAAVMMLTAVLRAGLCARCYTDGVSSSHENPAQYFPHLTDKQTKIGRD